ncbi:MAG: ATP-binding cassette domain-containing protein [Bacteroidales bacterium]|jgi:cell division transport system ATP-binding protein|nr:ATP-binding cassette domain-containing protein [Bacteroidales bacterium]
MEEAFAISIKDTDIYQREQLVLSQVNFQLINGEFVFLIGKVGSGKSSLIKTLNAELPVFNGEANVAGYSLQTIKTKDIPFLRRKIGVVFQDFKLLTDRSIYKNLHFVLKSTGWTDEKAMNERIDSILEEVGMVAFKQKMPHQLSGGEQQRIVIARALLNNPEIILADEPTGNLDFDTSVGILELFKKINSEGKTVLMATHDKLVVDKYPARTLICSEGKLIDAGMSQGEQLDFRSFID